jgi:excinuclease ABC subunit C
VLQRPSDLPTDPGVYRFWDEAGRVIYVGKAKNLRSRLSQYFADSPDIHPRTQSMLGVATRVDFVTVTTEAEALILEYSWIKEFDPRFNVKYRDDKSYPYVAISTSDEFPRVYVTREHHRRGTKYFGPFAQAWAIRDTLDHLQWVIPVRTCRDGVFARAKHSGRPCLLGYIDKCSAPCVGRIEKDAYDNLVQQFISFLNGDSDSFLHRLRLQMTQAAAAEEFEEAARIRDRLDALQSVLTQNVVSLSPGTDADVIGIIDETLEMGVQIFHVRNGRVLGERSFILEKDEDLDTAEYVDRVLQHVYSMPDVHIPQEVLLSQMPASLQIWRELLSDARGSKVDVRVPTRGAKRQLMEIVCGNAQMSLDRHQLSRAKDLNTRSLALRQLQEVLNLPEAPLRIECIDISTIQGQHTVGSLVVFEDGMPRTSDYRNYIIQGKTDDLHAVAEVVHRRFRTQGDSDKQVKRSQYPPSLLIIDGGLPQVQAATQALMDVGVTDIAVIGLAKRMEEVWTPDGSPIILSRTSEGLFLLQRIRDEAHRRAITFHRKRRGKAMTASILDGVPGLGSARAKAIVRWFGSVRRLKEASVEEISQVPGIGPVLAERIKAHIEAQEK